MTTRAKASPSPSQGQLEVRTQFMKRGVALVERAQGLRQVHQASHVGSLDLQEEMEQFIRDVLAVYGEMKQL